MKIIQLKDAWEQYRIKFVRDKRVFWEHIWALQSVNLKIEKGECIGIIGENGAGKTTLLKVIAGMLCPDKGEVNVEGRVSCLMELGTGFHPELTGRENVFLNAGLYGLSKEEIERKFDQIVEFSGIGKFIDAIVKSYSQGMYMRLAFALAIHVDPDILLIDDILAVGDEDAQQKCIKKIFELKEKGTTILFVTHNMDLLALLCPRAILLNKGKLLKDCSAEEAIIDYLRPTIRSIENKKIINFKPQEVTVSIQNGAMRILCDLGQKQIRFYHKAEEITQGNGLYTYIGYNGEGYYSSGALWIINKHSKEKIIFTLKYPRIPVTQFWQLEVREDSSVNLNIDLELADKVILTNQEIRLELNNKYANWVTPYENGDFGENGFKNRTDFVKSRLKNNKIDKVGLKLTPHQELCDIIFESASDNAKRIFFLYKQPDSLDEKILIQSLLINSSIEQMAVSNRYKFFGGNLSLNKKVEPKKESSNALNMIQAGNLRISFDEGRGRIFYNNIELTAGLGMYTSLSSQKIWYDSYQAIWDLREKNNSKIVSVGHWPFIPINQVWQIEILDETTILWQVEMIIYDKLDNLELEQTNLMLTPLYKDWAVSEKNQGVFLEEFADDYDISPYRFWYAPVTDKTKVVSSELPSIYFIYTGEEEASFRTIIENSDNFYKARRIQYQKINLRQFKEPANYRYFKGLIKIEPHG